MLRRITFGLTGIFILSIMWLAATVGVGIAQESSADEQMESVQLATAMISADLVQPMRAIVHARGNHFVVDSVPPLGSLSEERNPLDMFLGALATCGMFIYETGAMELDMPLESLSVVVEGDLTPAGVRDGSVNPRIRAFRVMIDAQGIGEDDFAVLYERFQNRCPIYTTLVRSAPIDVFNMNDVRSVDFQFGTHPQLGFPEQHVLLQQEGLAEDMGMRIDVDGAEVPANLDRELYAAAADIGHDPFSLEADPLGPFALGESLGITLSDWLAAGGGGSYTLRGNQAEISLSLENLVPNGIYTVWCSRIGLPPQFTRDNKPCGAADGSENSFQADAQGHAEFTMSTRAMPPTGEDVVSVIALAYHSDGQTYGESPGVFGLNSHVQVFTILPPPGDEAWTGGSHLLHLITYL